MRLRAVILALIGAALIVAMAGCGSAVLTGTAGTAASQHQAAPEPNVTAAQKSALKGSAIPKRTRNAMRALSTAAAKVPNGRPYDLETEHHRGKTVWEIKVASGDRRPYKLYISFDGRRVVRSTRHKRDDDVAKVLKAKVTLRRALKTAAKRVPWRLSEAEIDRYRGKIVWEVEFTKGSREREVIVNAKTGKIVRVKTDDHDH